MSRTAVETSPPRALVDLVLRQVQVVTNVCTRQVTERGYVLPRRVVPDYNLIFVRRGRVVWVIEQTPWTLNPGDLVFVPPGVPHHGHSETRSMTLGSIHVEARLAGGQDVFELLTPPRWQHVAEGSTLARYLEQSMAEFDRDEPTMTRLMMCSWGRLVTLELLRDNAERGLLRHRPVDPLIVDVLEELNRRVAEPTTLTDLAERAGFSPQHLNRLFRKHIGVTPLQYLARLRMEAAAILLADGRLTVRAVAERVGYEDPYSFSRVFKGHFGRSPAQYRDALGNGSDLPSGDSAGPFAPPPPAG